MYNAVIFDFDGTICDTGEGIKKSAKYALDAYGIEANPWEELDHFIGPPLLVTFQEQYNQSVTQAEELVKKFRERYTNIGLYESKLYDGLDSLLKALKASGIKIGIASSKPEQYVTELLKKFGIYDMFDSVCAVSFNADCESKQSIIHRCLEELEVQSNQAIMVGDRFYDIDGARENMLDGIGVLWGYGNKFEFIECGASYIVDKMSDIEAIALGLYEKTENVQKIFDGVILHMHKDDITLCNGRQSSRECVDHPGGVGVIGITDDNQVLLVRQFRYPYKELIFEIPAGKLDRGEDPLEAGMREFQEECGATADKYTSLGKIYPTPGYTNEIIHLFLAEGLHFGEQKLDEGEFLSVIKMSYDTLYSKVMSGEIKDAKTIISTLKVKELRSNK